MRNKVSLFFLCYLLMLLLLGCGNENTAKILVNATTPIEVEDNALNDVSVTLPEEMSRLPKSEIQHDFIKDGNQVGGIVIVDVSDEMLNSPRGENMLKIAGVLGEQLMPHENPDEIEFICAGGNKCAYMEIYTGGGERIRYCHYLFRGETNNYDVWFDYSLVNDKIITEILATVSAEDITDELNKSAF